MPRPLSKHGKLIRWLDDETDWQMPESLTASDPEEQEADDDDEAEDE